MGTGTVVDDPKGHMTSAEEAIGPYNFILKNGFSYFCMIMNKIISQSLHQAQHWLDLDPNLNHFNSDPANKNWKPGKVPVTAGTSTYRIGKIEPELSKTEMKVQYR
jgi:hypothetical protein